jgi:hypothetical protein
MSIQQRQESLKKKIQVQNMVILALAIVIIVLIVVSSTAAWYIRTKSDSADIILSNPVNIYITEFDENGNHEMKQDILEGYNNRIYPGDRIKLKLGMQIGTEKEASSSAYVRVKLSMAFSKISNDPNEPDIPLQELADDNLIEYENKPDGNDWQLVDFADPTGEKANDPNHETDYWYVLKVSPNKARVAQDGEKLESLNGYIKLSKTEITNKHANCKFHIVYTVEAIQIVNVADPLEHKGFGPWWGNDNEPQINS